VSRYVNVVDLLLRKNEKKREEKSEEKRCEEENIFNDYEYECWNTLS
jgi:hypothetical protein